MKKQLEIDGNSFSDLAGFYDEVERKLTKDLDFKIGRNLDAFNDVLSGGFCVHDVNEEIVLRWKNSEKSKSDLGFDETVKNLEEN